MVNGIDVDPICAKMAVINLYLLQIGGRIIHGNALSLEYHTEYFVLHSKDGAKIHVNQDIEPLQSRITLHYPIFQAPTRDQIEGKQTEYSVSLPRA